MKDARRLRCFDHNASTPIDPEVFAAMEPWLRGSGANPSSSHEMGRRARHAIDRARVQVARALGGSQDEVVFTGSGTEANNLAILGTARGKKHLVTDEAEHSSVLGPARQLAREGVEVDFVRVDAACLIDLDRLLARVRPDTALVSVGLANNEIGTLQPIAEIRRRLPRNVLLHCDAAQAVGKIAVDFGSLGADLLSVSARKLYGPAGAAALLVKKGTRLDPILFGGDQERGLRAGSEDVPAIVGFGCAAELATSRLARYREEIGALAARFRTGLRRVLPFARVNSPETDCLANTVNVSFPGIDGRSLLIRLDLEGIAVSLGSACASGSILPSHVLLAMGRDREEALSSIRFSFGWGNVQEDVDFLLETLGKILGEF